MSFACRFALEHTQVINSALSESVISCPCSHIFSYDYCHLHFQN